MAYQSGKLYWFLANGGSGRALSVYGNSQVSQNRNVIIWDKQTIADQLWRVDVGNGFARIKTKLNEAYALNIWKGSTNNDNCDIHTWSDNIMDSQVDLMTVNSANNLYRIKLVNDDRYLTIMGSGNGADVRWKPWTGYDTQLWKLVEYDDGSGDGGGDGGGETPVTNRCVYPCKVMRITQNYNGADSHYNCSHGIPADYPIDEGCEAAGSRSYIYCPCDEIEIVRIYTAGPNTIWLRSTSPVTMPCGVNNLMMMVIHPNDDDVGTLTVGQKFTRGQAMFREGDDGAASGAYHFHISAGTGTTLGNGGTGWKENNLGSWVLQVEDGEPKKPYEVFFLDASFTTEVKDTKGILFEAPL